MYPAYNGDIALTLGYGKQTYIIDLNTGFDEENRIVFKQSGSLDLSSLTKILKSEYVLRIPFKVLLILL